MIADPTNPSPGAVPHPFTLNDLRPHVHSSIPEEPSPTYRLTVYGLVPTVVVAIGAFIWLDPLHLFARTEATPPAPALVASAEPALPTERLEVTAPRTPVPATKSVQAPIAPMVQAPQVPAPVARHSASSVKPESRGNPMDRTNKTGPKENLRTEPEQETAPPALLTKPEERTDAPIVPKPDDDTKSAPKPAATNDQPPVTE
jgi:hypothetical protein